jgi:hypothetical protein
MDFLKLMDYVLKNGGATIEVLKNDSYNLIEKDSGYFVASDKEIKFDIKKDFDKIVKYFLNKNDNVIIGLWLDNRILYIDEEVYYIHDLETALMIGKKYNQKAIYSCGENKSIYL